MINHTINKSNKLNKPKKIAVINDMAGYGRCSMTIALPVISACRVQACPVPTSIFSNHTGFASHYKIDLTDYLTDYLQQWNQLSVFFDGILCGYLGSVSQMAIMDQFIKDRTCQDKKPMVIIDPVMGDHGKTYKTITTSFCSQMKHFIHGAKIVTPNLTEACILTDTPYKDGCWTEKDLLKIACQLKQMGSDKLVITGIRDKDTFHNFIYENETSYSMYSTPITGGFRHGTGDIFAGILSALCVRGYSFSSSVQKAADFIATVIKASSDADVPEQEGVIFENFLEILAKY